MFDASDVRERIEKEFAVLRQRRRAEWFALPVIGLVALGALTANFDFSPVLFSIVLLITHCNLNVRDQKLLELLAATTAKRASESPNSPEMGMQP
ncbi:MAG: hypothetical protein HZA46_00880 [Planctomycetales bacterium]|nr:hypothetical protein [Planctomycetales bacterium]